MKTKYTYSNFYTIRNGILFLIFFLIIMSIFKAFTIPKKYKIKSTNKKESFNENNKIWFLSFASENHYKTLNRIKNEAEALGLFDNIVIVKESDLKTSYEHKDFWDQHADFIKNNSRGWGYWLWKSYLTMKTLDKMTENDILVYADAGCSLHDKEGIKNQFDIVIKSNYGILGYEMTPLTEKDWTKMDLFEYLDMRNEKELNAPQLHATTFTLRKCDHSVNIVKKWYETSSIYHNIDDTPSILTNDPGFADHRHDQSIFSLLRKKYGVEIRHGEPIVLGRIRNKNIKD